MRASQAGFDLGFEVGRANSGGTMAFFSAAAVNRNALGEARSGSFACLPLYHPGLAIVDSVGLQQAAAQRLPHAVLAPFLGKLAAGDIERCGGHQ